VLAETYSYGTVRTAQYFLAAILSRFGGIIDSAQYCRASRHSRHADTGCMLPTSI
jgi:hypothetical protein